MSDLLHELNEQQIKAVKTPPGPVLILAGPGSGKTRVLTYRIAYLIAALGVPAYQIMAVTFTNKAAKEMGARVTDLLGSQADGIWLGTFHAICGRILRREAEHLPIDHNYVIFDADDQVALIKRIIKEMHLNEKDYRPHHVLAKISQAKNDLIGAENFPTLSYRDENIQAIYKAYQAYLVSSNAVDFDDMLLYTANLFEQNTIVRQKYARHFQHILVDEFQDTNLAQYELLRHLASYHQNLFTVGDEDQSIYRWRGADYRNLQRFKDDFKKNETILLEQNYRSRQTILDAAMAVINQNPNRSVKDLFTQRGHGEPVVVYEAADDHEEATYVVEAIARQVMLGKAHEADFAVMYRTNAQSRLLEEAFRRANMSYRLVGAQRFYGRREVKDAIAFLRLIYNPKDEVSLARVINLPPRGIGTVTLQSLQNHAHQTRQSSGEILLSLADGQQSQHEAALGRGAAPLRKFAKLLSGWRDTFQKVSLTSLFDQVLLETDYESYIVDESSEEQDRWANILELRQVLLEYEDRGLAEFLETMALVSDQDTLPETLDAPTLLTLHAAKGLEFPQVFIIGLDEHYLPHSRSRDEPEELAEECRLLYVGMTRAQDQLYLLRALRRRSPYGSYETMQPSRFLDALPQELLHGSFRKTTMPRDAYDRSVYLWDQLVGSPVPQNQRSQPPPAVEQRFSAGMQVEHPAYGEGQVRKSILEYGDETVEVYFEGVGLKALVASMSRLKILDD